MSDADGTGQGVMRFADDALLADIVGLLPPDVVTVKEGLHGVACPFVRYLVADRIKDALIAGHEIDRTNADGPLADWDGWLLAAMPEKPLYIQIAAPGGGPLKDF